MSASVWITVVAGGVGTFLLRWSFLSVAHRAGTLPREVREALRMIPAAALAALVTPAVLRGGSADGSLALLDPRVLAAACAMAVMWRTRQVLTTLVVGMAVLIGLQALG